MGKVLSSFNHGYAGAIARSVDDIVISLANKSDESIPFGAAVALDEDKTGIIPFDASTHTGADFVGITVRNPSKTPDAYGANEGFYAADDLVDVLVRGHIIVRMSSGSPALGKAVSIAKSNGAFTVNTGDSYVALPNVRTSAEKDSTGMVEIVLTERNIL